MKRHALIIGASGQVGLPLCQFLSGRGWEVTGLSRKPPHLPGIFTQSCDLTQPDTLPPLLDSRPPVDALLLPVGHYHRTPWLEESVADFQAEWSANLLTVFNAIQSCFPRMKAQKSGKIITFALVGTHTPSPNLTAHALAKGGVIALTRMVAVEGAPYGITANCLSPGVLEQSHENEVQRQTPQIPRGTPVALEEVLNLIGFLLSDQAPPSLTGAEIPLSGGWKLP